MKGNGGGQIFLHDKTSFLSGHPDLEKSPLYDSECLGNLSAFLCDSHIYLATFLWEKGTGLTSINVKLILNFNTFIDSNGWVGMHGKQGIRIEPKTFCCW